jgi:virginiamycin B lyase
MTVDLREAILRAGGNTNVHPDLGSIAQRAAQRHRRRTLRRAALAVTGLVALATLIAALLPGETSHPTVVTSTPTDPIRAIASFPLPAPNRDLTHIVQGSDGNMWFTTTNSQIGRVTPTGVITVFPLPDAPASQAGTIASGPDGNIWFGDYLGRIGRIQIHAPHTITLFPLPPHVTPGSMTTGPDHNLWFSERVSTTPSSNTGRIARITPNGSLTEFAAPVAVLSPAGIVTGPDHNLWFNDFTGEIGRITTSGHYTLFPLSAAAKDGGGGFGITVGPDGNLWFTEQRGVIGYITPRGVTTELPKNGDSSFGITDGPDGSLWFGAGGDTIGRITTKGVITKYALNTPNSPGFAAFPAPGPKNTLWVTEQSHIVRITVASARH